MPRRSYAAPDRVSPMDAFRIIVGVLSLLAGIAILARTLSAGVYLPAMVSGGAFIAFGAYRLWIAWVGWQLYRATKGGKRQ